MEKLSSNIANSISKIKLDKNISEIFESDIVESFDNYSEIMQLKEKDTDDSKELIDNYLLIIDKIYNLNKNKSFGNDYSSDILKVKEKLDGLIKVYNLQVQIQDNQELIERHFKEIINLNPGKYYEYVRYINNTVNIKPLTWVLLGFDYTRITGRLINDQYPKWTLTMIGDALDPDENLREDKVITTHNGLYFTYLFEDEGIYKIKLELMDINDNKYDIEKSIIIVDKDANYEMYHTLNDEYENYLNSINDRNSIYLNYR
jgi:hypothetical protein